jgi:hypothetical protein
MVNTICVKIYWRKCTIYRLIISKYCILDFFSLPYSTICQDPNYITESLRSVHLYRTVRFPDKENTAVYFIVYNSAAEPVHFCAAPAPACKKIPAPARTIFLIKFYDFHVFKKFSCFFKT